MTSTSPSPAPFLQILSPVVLPRITIKYCIKCKWMLRAAYYAQELLSTFSLSLGEVSLIPSTSGTFQIDIIHASPSTSSSSAPLSTPLWDRKTDGGFPETKILKQRVRDVIEPGRHLGHVDGKRETDAAEEGKKEGRAEAVAVEDGRGGGEAAGCEDCN